jgi:hypothetical protein
MLSHPFSELIVVSFWNTFSISFNALRRCVSCSTIQSRAYSFSPFCLPLLFVCKRCVAPLLTCYNPRSCIPSRIAMTASALRLTGILIALCPSRSCSLWTLALCALLCTYCHCDFPRASSHSPDDRRRSNACNHQSTSFPVFSIQSHTVLLNPISISMNECSDRF